MTRAEDHFHRQQSYAQQDVIAGLQKTNEQLALRLKKLRGKLAALAAHFENSGDAYRTSLVIRWLSEDEEGE